MVKAVTQSGIYAIICPRGVSRREGESTERQTRNLEQVEMWVLSGWLILGMIAALVLALVESQSGYWGDSSMLPGCLLIVLVGVVIILVVGFAMGMWAVHLLPP